MDESELFHVYSGTAVEHPPVRGRAVKKRLELRHLHALVCLVEEGGYVRAAKVLGVTQSTMSETIRSLERLAGGPVVRRVKNTLSLTPIGEVLLPIAHRMLALESEALSQLAET